MKWIEMMEDQTIVEEEETDIYDVVNEVLVDLFKEFLYYLEEKK